MATATREAYGKTLAKLIVEHDDLFVLDADLTKSTKTIDARMQDRNIILIWELPKEI